MRRRPANFYVLERKTGKEILVTGDVAHLYRNAIDYIRLRKPAPQDVNADVPVPPEATRVGRKRIQTEDAADKKRQEQERKRNEKAAAVKKAAPKKKAAKKKAAKS